LDPVTHLLTGACLGRTGFNRKTPWATLTMALAAEAPDLDIVAYLAGPVVGFAHHRGLTHTFVGILFMAALVVGTLYFGYRLYWQKRTRPAEYSPPRWGLLYFFAVIAGLSHILLDYITNYGVRPFAPFHWQWYSWDIVFIIEPVMLVALMIGLVMPRLFSLISEEIGERKSKLPRGRGWAIFALLVIVVFWGVRDFYHRRALGALNSLTYGGKEPLRVSAFPYPVLPFRWYAVVETEDEFHQVLVDSRNGEVDREGRGRVRHKPEETEVSLAAKRSYLGRVYLDWARYPYWEVEQTNDPRRAYIVRFFDLRYNYPDQGRKPLRCQVELDRNLNVVAEIWGSD
jgi:inner membrane protein